MSSASVTARAATANPRHWVKTLSGVYMPKLIYGTAWKKEGTADLVVTAVQAGFRGVDTACQPKHYHEPGVGEALKQLATNHGISRESLFIQTKFTSLDGQDPNRIPYDTKAPLEEQVKQSLATSLGNLGTSYIDSLVLHGPLRTFDKTMAVWRTFESFVSSGQVRQLGMSNCYDIGQFTRLFNEAMVKPAVLQNRLYPDTDYDKELRDFCKEKGIYYQSFWTLSANPHILRDRAITQLAKEMGKTPEQLFFAFLMQTGVVTPLTGTKNKTHMEQDLQAMDVTLTDEQMHMFHKFID